MRSALTGRRKRSHRKLAKLRNTHYCDKASTRMVGAVHQELTVMVRKTMSGNRYTVASAAKVAQRRNSPAWVVSKE